MGKSCAVLKKIDVCPKLQNPLFTKLPADFSDVLYIFGILKRCTLREKNKKIGVFDFKKNIDRQRFELLEFFKTHGRRHLAGNFVNQKMLRVES